MILYDNIARHNFLSEELCRKLVDSGIDMSDASYYLIKADGVTYVSQSPNIEMTNVMVEGDPIPTYTLSDMIYKMNEFPYIDGKPIGPLCFLKDAPFYSWAYYPKGSDAVDGIAETPIEAAAYLLIKSRENRIQIIENIKTKYDGK